jgi:hypothetical protein
MVSLIVPLLKVADSLIWHIYPASGAGSSTAYSTITVPVSSS